MKKKIITYGTFDMFHVGHLRLLKRLKEMGDELIVAVSTDAFNEIKGKKVLIPYEQRVEILEGIKFVDQVIPEYSWDQKINDIQEYGIHTFAIGSDWRGKLDHLEPFCEVVYLERSENISTTKLKKSLTNFLSIPKEDILNALDILEQLKKEFE